MKRIELFFGTGAAVALFLMMLLTFADVIGRKLIGGSIPGALELTEVFMLLTIFLGLPLTSLRAEHVVFDLLDPVVPAAGRRIQHVLAHAVCLAALLGAAWLVEHRALRAAAEGDHTSQLGLQLAPLHHLTAALLLATALAHGYLMFKSRTGEPAQDG